MLLFDPRLPKEARLAACRNSAELSSFCENEIEKRRRAPQDDFITALLNARSHEIEGEPMLSQRELVSVLAQILIAGNETTRRAIGNMMLLLLRHPKQMEAVRDNAALRPHALEETLRHTSPTKGLFRRTTCDVALGGVTIPAGALVLVLWASANRDESVFAAPDKFDILRADVDRHTLQLSSGVAATPTPIGIIRSPAAMLTPPATAVQSERERTASNARRGGPGRLGRTGGHGKVPCYRSHPFLKEPTRAEKA